MSEKGPSDYRVPSTAEDRSRKEFVKELTAAPSKTAKKIIKLNGESNEETCFAFKQKNLHGPLHSLTKRSALAAASAWAKGPQSSMSWKRFLLMAGITFTTARHCFPCWSWGTKGGCYHQDAVRQVLDLPPLTDPNDRKPAAKKGRGRKRRARALHFTADMTPSFSKKSHRC